MQGSQHLSSSAHGGAQTSCLCRCVACCHHVQVERATLDAASSVAAGAQQQGIGGLCLQMSTWYNTSAVRLAKLTTGRITGQQVSQLCL